MVSLQNVNRSYVVSEKHLSFQLTNDDLDAHRVARVGHVLESGSVATFRDEQVGDGLIICLPFRALTCSCAGLTRKAQQADDRCGRYIGPTLDEPVTSRAKKFDAFSSNSHVHSNPCAIPAGCHVGESLVVCSYIIVPSYSYFRAEAMHRAWSAQARKKT